MTAMYTKLRRTTNFYCFLSSWEWRPEMWNFSDNAGENSIWLGYLSLRDDIAKSYAEANGLLAEKIHRV